MINPPTIQNLGASATNTIDSTPAVAGQRQVSQNEGTTTILDQILEKIRSIFSNVNTPEARKVQTTAETNTQTIKDFLAQNNGNNRIGHQFLDKLLKNEQFTEKFVSLDKIRLENFLNSITKTYTPFEGIRAVDFDIWNLRKAKILTNILSESSSTQQEDKGKQDLIKMYIAFNIEARAPNYANEIEGKEPGAFYEKFNAWAEKNPDKLKDLENNILHAEESPITGELFASKELMLAAEEIMGPDIQQKTEN